MNDNNSLAHTTWNCKYHIVFAPEKQVRITAEISAAQSRAEELSRKLQQLGCSVKTE